MPIQILFVEPGIYQGDWSGTVTIDEVYASMQEVSDAAAEHGDDRYAVLVNLSDVKHIPFDLRNLLKISNSDDHVVEFIIIKAPAIGQALGNMLHKLSNQPFSFANTIDEGIASARKHLADEQMPPTSSERDAI